MLVRSLAAAALLALVLVPAAPAADALTCELISPPPAGGNAWRLVCNYVDCYWETSPQNWTRDCL